MHQAVLEFRKEEKFTEFTMYPIIAVDDSDYAYYMNFSCGNFYHSLINYMIDDDQSEYIKQKLILKCNDEYSGLDMKDPMKRLKER